MNQSNPTKIRDRAIESIALNENPTFQEAIQQLRERYYGELIQATPGTLTASAVHAKLQVLEDLPGQLNIFINDAKIQMRQR